MFKCVCVEGAENWWTNNNELLLYTRQMERLTNTLLAMSHIHRHTYTNICWLLYTCTPQYWLVCVVFMSSHSPFSFPSFFPPSSLSPLFPLSLLPLLTSPPSPVSSHQSLFKKLSSSFSLLPLVQNPPLLFFLFCLSHPFSFQLF